MNKEGMETTFEYTARHTPQQNGKVERNFATLYGRMRAMKKAANFNSEQRSELWTEAASTATKLDNIIVDNKKDKSAYQKFYGRNTKYEKHLKIFGEVGIVTEKNKGPKDKISNRGIKCMFVGYAKDHDGDVYRMFN